jgi:hypothetical protein
MALTGHFLDFAEEVSRVRAKMVAEINTMMMVENPNILCGLGVFGVTTSRGDEQVSHIIRHEVYDTVIITVVGEEEDNDIDITELNTDDLVALYEYLFYLRYPDGK